MTAETDAMWAEFHASLVWRPIAEYDRAEGHVVLLKSNGDEAIGYWQGAMWWHAQDSLDDQHLDFVPRQFAEVREEWRIHLMAD